MSGSEELLSLLRQTKVQELSKNKTKVIALDNECTVLLALKV